MKKFKWLFIGLGVIIVAVAAYFIIGMFLKGPNLEETYKYIAVQFKKDGKISLINLDGKIVLEDEFSNDSKVFYSDGVIIETKAESVKYWAFDGKKTKEIADGLKISAGTPFVNGYAVIRKENGMLALIDKKGGEVIQNLSVIENIKILGAGIVSDDLIRVKSEEGLWGYVSVKGEFKIKPTYKVCENFVDGKARVKKSDGTVAIIDKTGKALFTGKEDVYYFPYSDGLIGYYEKTNSSEKNAVGFVDINNEKVIKDSKYYLKESNFYTYKFKNGISVISGEDRDSWGIINKEGEIVGDLKTKFEIEPLISTDGKVFINDPKEKKCKIFSNKGEEIAKIEDYEYVFPITAKRNFGVSNQKVVLIDDKGKEVGKIDKFYINDQYIKAFNDNTEFLNSLYLQSEYFDFESIYTNVFKVITNTGMLDVNQNSNISAIMAKWPYENTSNAAKSKELVSRYDDYRYVMFSQKDEKDKKDEKDEYSADSEYDYSAPKADTTKSEVRESYFKDNYPYIIYSTYSPKTRSYDVISYNLSFNFNGYLKKEEYTEVYDPYYDYSYRQRTGYSLNNDVKLKSIDFNLASPSAIDYQTFLKQFTRKLESLNWKKESENKYVNVANNNRIEINSYGFRMFFPNNDYVQNYWDK